MTFSCEVWNILVRVIKIRIKVNVTYAGFIIHTLRCYGLFISLHQQKWNTFKEPYEYFHFWKCKPRQIKLPLSVRQNNMDMYNYSYQTDRVVPLIKIKLILRRIHCKNPTEANGPRHWVCCLPYDVKTVLSHDSDLFIIIISFIIFFLSEMLLGRRKLFNELTMRALVTVPGIDC